VENTFGMKQDQDIYREALLEQQREEESARKQRELEELERRKENEDRMRKQKEDDIRRQMEDDARAKQQKEDEEHVSFRESSVTHFFVFLMNLRRSEEGKKDWSQKQKHVQN
jgi:hypothetical protein